MLWKLDGGSSGRKLTWSRGFVHCLDLCGRVFAPTIAVRFDSLKTIRLLVHLLRLRNFRPFCSEALYTCHVPVHACDFEFGLKTLHFGPRLGKNTCGPFFRCFVLRERMKPCLMMLHSERYICGGAFLMLQTTCKPSPCYARNLGLVFSACQDVLVDSITRMLHRSLPFRTA